MSENRIMYDMKCFGKSSADCWSVSSEPQPEKYYFNGTELKDIIAETVAAVFERERLYKEYDRLTAEFDRRRK